MSEVRVEKLIKDKAVKQVMLQFTDILGKLHSLWIPAESFLKIAHDGIHVDGSSVQMADISISDIKLKPDLRSFKLVPLPGVQTQVARVICDLYEPESDKPLSLDPRLALKKAVKSLKEKVRKTAQLYASPELEFFLFKQTEKGIDFYDRGGYLATPPSDLASAFRLKVIQALGEAGVFVEKHHHEVPPGKYEFNLKFREAVGMIDDVMLTRFLVKTYAVNEGLIATFMPKPFHGQYGAGMHTHVSVMDEETGENLFYEEDGEFGLSDFALGFLAGILHHARALAAVTNPSVNSYKRLVPGWEAPVYVSWARYNRSVLVRVPPGKGGGTRFEYRPTDGTCNFYLALACILVAGLDGVEKGMKPPEPVEENIYEMGSEERASRGIEELPENLGEALKELSKDPVLRGALGRELYEKFMELKLKEWREYNVTVHEWERERYLEV